MNSPKTSVQTSAPVAALRAALPTDVNAKVDEALAAVHRLDESVVACVDGLGRLSDYSSYGNKAACFARASDVEIGILRGAVLERFPAFARLRQEATRLPPLASQRIISRLDSALEDAVETSALAAEPAFLKIKDVFSGKEHIDKLSSDQLAKLGTIQDLHLAYHYLQTIPAAAWGPIAEQLGKVRSLDFSQNNLDSLSIDSWRLLAPQLGKLKFLNLTNNDLSKLSPEVWELLAPELAKVPALDLTGALHALSPKVWSLLAPALGSVKWLDLSSNGLWQLSPEIWRMLAANLGKQRFLSLRDNFLWRRLDAEAWGSIVPGLSQLKGLDLSENNCSVFPHDVWPVLAPALGRLRYFRCSKAKLAELHPQDWSVLAPELMKIPALDISVNRLHGWKTRLNPAAWAPLSARPKGPDFQY